MKLWIRADDVEVELQDGARGSYSPDLLDDWCNRLSKLIQEQRALTVCLNQAEPHVPGGG